MKMISWMPCEPQFHFLMLVSRIVVDHQVNIQVRRDVCIDMSQELKELLMTVALFALGNHVAVSNV